MEKALVIGGGGFLGSHVSDLLTQGGYDVSIFDHKISPYISVDQQMIIGDILDRDMIRKAIKGVDYVFHFAAVADIKEARDNPEHTAQLM